MTIMWLLFQENLTTKKRGYGQLCSVSSFFGILHHHRLLATVCEGEYKPSVIVDGDTLYDGAESAVLPFGVEEVELAKLKEESAELVRLELLVLSLACESRITLL